MLPVLGCWPGQPGPRSSPARAPEGPHGGRQPPRQPGPEPRSRPGARKLRREGKYFRRGREKKKKEKAKAKKMLGFFFGPVDGPGRAAGRWEGAGGAAARCAEVVSRRGSVTALGPAPRVSPAGWAEQREV